MADSEEDQDNLAAQWEAELAKEAEAAGDQSGLADDVTVIGSAAVVATAAENADASEDLPTVSRIPSRRGSVASDAAKANAAEPPRLVSVTGSLREYLPDSPPFRYNR